ncbi:MAG: helix-turn-helix domain-containing protein, partial [Bryobacteraceae bacterium]
MNTAAVEQTMKVRDVILKAMAKKINWLEAAEIVGVCDRTMRRMRERYQEFGYTGLFDQRRGKRSTHCVPMETAERWHDFIVILDDATSEIYYAQLVEEESTRTVMAALREVIETQGL